MYDSKSGKPGSERLELSFSSCDICVQYFDMIQLSTHLSKLMFGSRPSLPGFSITPEESLNNDNDSNGYVDARIKQLTELQQEINSQVLKNINAAQVNLTKNYNKRHSRQPLFHVGDEVLIRNCKRNNQ